MDKKISVIVPVYNAEKYLRKCLDTLVNQTYENIEFLLIDDGSTDSSPDILNEYEQKDSRVHVYNRLNFGPGAVRNFGIQEATGDYVSFIDADDWVLLTLYSDFIKTLNELGEDIDIYTFNACSYIKGKNDCIPNLFFNIIDWGHPFSDLTKHVLTDCKRPLSSNLSSVNKIYRREFLLENNLEFPEDIRFEDVPFSFKAQLVAKSIIMNDKVYYRYRNYMDITRSTQVSDNVFDVFKMIDILCGIINEKNCYQHFKYALFQYMYVTYLSKYDLCPTHLKESFYNEMRKRVIFAEQQDLDPNVVCQLRDYDKCNMLKQMDFNNFERYWVQHK